MDHDFSRMDKIYIRDLLLRCIIGINSDERVNKQDVVTNVTLYADLSKPGQSDSIDDTVNYKALKDRIAELINGSSYFLVEKLAEEVASTCLSFEGVRAAKVLVEKPGALRFARTVGVEIFRSNHER